MQDSHREPEARNGPTHGTDLFPESSRTTIRGGRGSAPNCTDGELLDDESTSAEIPEPQIDGTRDLWM